MKAKYYKYTLEGEHSAEDAQRALGEEASASLIVRVDKASGQTHVFVADQGTAAPKSGTTKSASTPGKSAAVPSGIKRVEVSESDLTKIR